MPYPRKQAVAIFMDIQRKRGQAAAEAFGRKHRGDMAKSAKSAHSHKPYSARKRRSS